jgi:ribose transport system substrate-binding protein
MSGPASPLRYEKYLSTETVTLVSALHMEDELSSRRNTGKRTLIEPRKKQHDSECAGPGTSRSAGARPLVLLGFAILLACLLAACGGSKSTSSGSNASASSGSSTNAANSGAQAASVGPTSEQPTTRYVRWSQPKASPHLSKIFGISILEKSEIFTQFVEGGEKESASCKMESTVATSEANAATQVNQVNSFVQRGAGAIFAQDFDDASMQPVLLSAMKQGIGVSAFNMKADTQITASQYAAGQLQAETVLKYIKENLNDKAELVHFNVEHVLPDREAGWNSVMKKAPAGVKIVANIPANPETTATGNKAMTTVLQAHPGVNIVDGTDTPLLGALAAVEAAGKQRQVAFIGFNGDPQAIKDVEKGGPYKATVGYDFAVMGALAGQYACDWVNGYNVPQLVVVKGFVISSKQSAQEFAADIKQATTEPAAAIQKAEGKYYDAYGSISYATRGNYFNGSVK